MEDEGFRDTLETKVMEYILLNLGTASNRGIECEPLKVVVLGHCLGQTVGIRKDPENYLIHLETTLHKWEAVLGTDPDAPQRSLEIRELHNAALECLHCHDHKAYMRAGRDHRGRARRCRTLCCARERAGERRGRECAAPEPTGAGVVWDPVSRRTGRLEPNEQLTGKRRRDLGGRTAQRVARWGLRPPRPQKTALRAAARWAVGPEIRALVPCWALAPHGAPSAGCSTGPGGAEIKPALERGERAKEQGRGDEKERRGPRPRWTHTFISLIWCPERDIGPLRDGAQLAQQLRLTGTPGGSRGNSRFACSRTITPEEPNS
ncbi:hypothetical protein NDU88_004463 [Pleurodeles waltl]|uniref:Uncharacterized protein n=1 Tax=Pleurodeles waltl TaxID=8319 RepID=A0AAV7WYC2_PLEWA|nr:hypothetical protein NDU88_004463 [Pleurodeles waltl]